MNRFIGALGALALLLAGSVRVVAATGIAWTSNPGQAANGENYYIEAHGWSDNGSLNAVSVWKDWAPHAFGGGGNGWDNWSGNSRWDYGEAYVTFMAEAYDSDGGSGYIYHTVHILPPPPNNPPGIEWTSAPSEAESGQSYYIQAHGWDPDGNLAQVTLWKNWTPHAFAGGGDGWNEWAGNPSTDSGEQWVEYEVYAGDGNGNFTGTLYHTVHIKPPNTPPTVAWVNEPSVNPASAEQSTWYTIKGSGHDDQNNMTGVHIYREGAPFAFELNGNQTDATSDNPDYASGAVGAIVTYTLEAHDSYGASSVSTQGWLYHQVVITAPRGSPPEFHWTPGSQNLFNNQPYTVTANASDPEGYLRDVWVNHDHIILELDGSVTVSTEGPFVISSSNGGPIAQNFYGQTARLQKSKDHWFAVAWDQAIQASFPFPAGVQVTGSGFTDYSVNRAPSTPQLTVAQSTIGLGQSVVISSFVSDADENETDHWLFWQGPNDGPTDWHVMTVASQPSGSANSTINYTFTPTALGTYHIKTRANDPYVSTIDISVDVAVVDITPPVAPTDCHVASVYSDRVQVLWSLSSSNDVTSQSLFWRSLNGGPEYSVTLGANVTGYYVTGLTSGTPHRFYVKANDGAGNVSPASGTDDATTLNIPAPTQLATDWTLNNSVTVEWVPSTYGYTHHTTIFWRLTSGGPESSAVVPPYAYYTVTGLTPMTSYHFYVRAYDETGNASPPSNAVDAIANGNADSDGDGIPDQWEVAHGLNPHNPADANADPDGDGLTNLQEYQLGTDPMVPATNDGSNSHVELKIHHPN